MKLQDEIIKRVRNLTVLQQEKMLKILEIWQKGRQREYQRLKTRSDIDVLVDDRLVRTHTIDISASGLYIRPNEKFEINKSVRIVFFVPGHIRPFKLQGVIIRAEANGIAVKFENITPYFQKILDDVIWGNIKEDVS